MRILKVIAITIAFVGSALVAPTAYAVGVGEEGCTPGYWKNHTDSWQEADPAQTVQSKYAAARANVAGWTLLRALDGGGGPGADGAAQILARAAVAAWLNAANDDLGYPWRRAQAGVDGRPPLVTTVNAAFASGDRATMLALATRLDGDNNLGCPLN